MTIASAIGYQAKGAFPTSFFITQPIAWTLFGFVVWRTLKRDPPPADRRTVQKDGTSEAILFGSYAQPAPRPDGEHE